MPLLTHLTITEMFHKILKYDPLLLVEPVLMHFNFSDRLKDQKYRQHKYIK